MNEMPAEPLTPMHQFAGLVKEFYDSLIHVGFDKRQALYLTGEWLKNLQQNAVHG